MADIVEAQALPQSSPPEAKKATVTGDLRLHPFQSRILGNQRMLRVWLPPGYDDVVNRRRRYPVLYLNDGQNLFDAATSYIGVEWQADEAADRLIRENRIPAMIIVGIDNAQKDRAKEYLPYPNQKPPFLKVQGKIYPAFLTKEVMPFINHTYRTANGAENTGLGGSSFGAIISLHTIMARPGVFGRVLLESPSLFVSGRQLLRDSETFRQWPQRIFLAIGTMEAGHEQKFDQQVVSDVRDLEEILRKAGLGEDRVKVEIEDGATHNEAAWAKRLPEALVFLFAGQ
jgi:predicted alpha/beta superfamily hydrolase